MDYVKRHSPNIWDLLYTSEGPLPWHFCRLSPHSQFGPTVVGQTPFSCFLEYTQQFGHFSSFLLLYLYKISISMGDDESLYKGSNLRKG